MSDEASIPAEEQQRAVRLLLAHPFVTDSRPDPETFSFIRRHARELQRWFAEQLGYRLVVDSELARLHKRPAPGARLRPVRTQSNSAFDPRRYALLCLVLAALERLEVQTVLSELAGQVALLAASEEGVRRLDLQAYAERQAFVDVVRWLVSLGVLALADGEDTAFLEGRGDALYDIHSRRLTQLLTVPVPASPPADLADLGTEVYPDTEDGANRRARHRLMRRLIEEPALYLDDLEETERAYLTSQRHYLVGQVTAKTGLVVEVRKEGLAAVDPLGRLTDLIFPGTGTVSHAALLLAERLASRALDESGLRAVLDSLVERYGHLWSQEYRDDRERLLSEALERLELMGLIAMRDGVAEPLPAIARYKLEEPDLG
jgi:uncharacterized protein (TIGR02678 family)